MNLFTIDLEKEKNKKTNLTTNILGNEKYLIENNFLIYYKPKFSDKLINETDVCMNLDYLPKFQSSSPLKKSNSKNINGGYLRVISKINICQISLSKIQLEQIIKTLDNIVYDDSKAKNDDSRRSTFNLADDQVLGFMEDYQNSNIKQSIDSSDFNESLSFKALYAKFSDEDKNSEDLSINVKFKIEKLTINFLADVEKPYQDIAELCFNEYELSILKHEKYVKFFDMTLKSLSLVDKLKLSANKNESKLKKEESFEIDSSYLLKSFTSLKGNISYFTLFIWLRFLIFPIDFHKLHMYNI